MARVSLLDGGGNVIAGPIRVNRWGLYGLPLLANAEAVRAECEGAATVDVPVSVDTSQLDISIEAPESIINDSAAPIISGMTATLDGASVGIFLPPASGVPSDNLQGSDVFFAYKGIDSRNSACQYYKAIGAVQGCDANGKPTGSSLSFDDWKRATRMDPFAEGGSHDAEATYVNQVDLNLTRNHHSISYGPNQVAGYVCNHLGPSDGTQGALNTAVDNAEQGKNLVACVAMDHLVHTGVNGNQPFTRFMIFGPDGGLLPSINLDGRTEKFVPGVCVACHGGDNYAGRFPEDGTGAANVGAHFLPYDAGNFGFSTAPGLTEADQTEQLYQLNQNLLDSGPTVAAQELIAGWYASSHSTNKNYLPASWQGESTAAINFYHTVYGKYCRTCHVNFTERLNFDHFDSVLASSFFTLDIVSCGYTGSRAHARNFSMPNSLTTFNLYWGSQGTAKDAPASTAAFLLEHELGSPTQIDCALHEVPRP